MIELILFLAVAFIGYIFLSGSSLNPFGNKAFLSTVDKINVPEDSVLRRHFLAQLAVENALVAAEIKRRLA
jgi:hypothetical protein